MNENFAGVFAGRFASEEYKDAWRKFAIKYEREKRFTFSPDFFHVEVNPE